MAYSARNMPKYNLQWLILTVPFSAGDGVTSTLYFSWCD